MSCDIISLLHIVTFNNLFFNRYSLLKRMHCLCHSSVNIRYSLSFINILTKKALGISLPSAFLTFYSAMGRSSGLIFRLNHGPIYAINSPTSLLTTAPSALPFTLGISSFMILPLSLGVAFSMPRSFNTP